jgi:hypothetical protein
MATLLSPSASAVTARSDSWLLAHAWKFAALTLLAIWVLAIGASHEPWFDEAQAWLIARDSGLYDLLAHRVRYEGTPGLWHVILWIVIRLGLPYSKLYLLSASLGIGAAAIVLWRAPFPPWMRVGIIFSYFFAYQFSVLARSYSVDLVLVPLLALWYPRRTEQPLRYAVTIGLLANLNAHGFVAAAALGMELAWQLFKQRKLPPQRALVALALSGALGLFALICAWQPADNGYIHHTAEWSFWKAAFWATVNPLRHAFIDRPFILSPREPQATDALLGLAVTFILLWPSIKFIASAPARAASLGALTALLLFSILVYSGPWHSGLLFLFWLFGLWVSWPSEPASVTREVKIGVAVIIGVQLVQTVSTGMWDLQNIYSPGRDAAGVVQRFRAAHPGARVAGFGFKSFAIQPYFPANQFANYKNGVANASWVDWRRGEAWVPMPQAPDWQKLLDGRPDLIVASVVHVDPALLIPAACRAGYAETHRFVGDEHWRGAHYEHDTLAIFERGTSPACRNTPLARTQPNG